MRSIAEIVSLPWPIYSLCPSPCGDCPANSCLRSFEGLEQEVAGCFVPVLVGQAWQVNCLVAAAEQAAAGIVAVEQLDIGLRCYGLEPAVGGLSGQASACTVAADIALEEPLAAVSAEAFAEKVLPVTAPTAE